MDNKTNKMLIDATHPEETRVVVLRNGRVEEFDYESAARKLLRGNIYLAKVTRVEPSLQAAFVEYGGNRHGFLAFNEIHPDYYQIPVSDRQALIDEEAAAEAEADAEADARAERRYQGENRSQGEPRSEHRGENRGREGSGRNRGRNGNRGRPHRRHHADATGSQVPGTGEQPGTFAPETVGLPEEQQVQAYTPASSDTPGHDQTFFAPEPADGSLPQDVQAVAAHDDHADHDHNNHRDQPIAHDHQSSAADTAADGGVDDAQHGEATSRAEASGHYAERITEDYAERTPTDDTSNDIAGDEDARGHAEDIDATSIHASHDQEGHEGQSNHFTANEGAPARHSPSHGGLDDSSGFVEEVTDVIEAPETIGADSGTDDLGRDDDGGDFVQDRPRRQRRRQYKIQEVIKRRQIILVQVVKEERGNKGAALTTYLSLAGRYTVLMPNTGRGGGISRKIVNPGDRKRLKAIAQELDVPEGMGLIIRTAGAARTNQEIKRDYEYLLRLWESVREMTLQSTAPSLVYEEGNLIKRSIRDLYSKEIDEIVVAGDQAYQDAHDFMRMLMPSQTKNVIRYTQPEALFTRYPIEKQLNAMFSPYVTLRSGGYLVINQTEALVSIDVNSGKSTREYSIEETALATNLEASDEIARQLKLRDLAGLIVIDFIDMEEKRNNRAVERRLTDALRFDRARIQIGRISHFGLLEMSRQRMRTGVLEGSTSQCPHCQGTGMIRATESIALAVLRGLEDHLVKDPRSSVNVLTTATVAIYILNNKRSFIIELERRYGVSIAVQASDRMQGANFTVERSSAPVTTPRPTERTAVSMDWGFDGQERPQANDDGDADADSMSHDHDEADSHGESVGNSPHLHSESQEGNRQGGRRRRRRRGRDRGDRQGQPGQPVNGDHGASSSFVEEGNGGSEFVDDQQSAYDNELPVDGGNADALVDDIIEAGDASDTLESTAGSGGEQAANARDEGDKGGRRGRRRGRRGGRRNQNREFGPQGNGEGGELAAQGGALLDDIPVGEDDAQSDEALADEPVDDLGAKHPHAEPLESVADAELIHAGEASVEHITSVNGLTNDHKPSPVTHHPEEEAPTKATVISDVSPEATHQPKPASVPVAQFPEAPDDPSRPRRKGWWQRRGAGE